MLTTEGLAGIVDLVRIGRAIHQRVLTWIINKISRTILKAGFVVVAFLATGKFVISALGMMLLIFMTDFMKVALATDRVRPSQRPETWRMGSLVGIAVVLGMLMLIESLGLLAFVWHRFDLADGQLATFSFQLLLFFAVFSILSIRERHAFWASAPAPLLATALAADIVAGWLVGLRGLGELQPLPIDLSATNFVYAIVCSLMLNDAAKRLLLRRVHGTYPPPPSPHELPGVRPTYAGKRGDRSPQGIGCEVERDRPTRAPAHLHGLSAFGTRRASNCESLLDIPRGVGPGSRECLPRIGPFQSGICIARGRHVAAMMRLIRVYNMST